MYVQGFPSGRKWQISTRAFGAAPRWRPDGKELFYGETGPLMAVDLTGTMPGGEFKAGPSQELFTGLLNLFPHMYDVTPGGRRFLLLAAKSGHRSSADRRRAELEIGAQAMSVPLFLCQRRAARQS